MMQRPPTAPADGQAASDDYPGASDKRLAGYVVAFGLCGLAIVIVLTILFAQSAWTQTVERSRRETQSTAFFLSEHAEQIFRVSDLALDRAIGALDAMSWDEAETSVALSRRLRTIRDDIPSIANLWLNDETGRLRSTSFAFPTPNNFSGDRKAFQVQREPGSGLYVGEAVRGRVTGNDTFIVSRRVEAPDHRFRGVAFATVDLDYFDDFWQRLTLPNGTRVSLVRAGDLSPVVTYPQKLRSLGDPGRFSEAIATGPLLGLYDFTSDDGARMGAYHRVADLPLYIRVTQSYAAMRSAWVSRMSSYAPFLLVALLASAGLTVLAGRLARAEDRALEGLDRAVRERTAELAEQTRLLDMLNTTGQLIAAELDVNRVVQAVVDAARDLAGAAFGSFFYRRSDSDRKGLRLHVLSGAAAADFASFPDPRDTALFEPTFGGRETICSGDVRSDPRYGGRVEGTAGGMPAGHLPVTSYLAVPVVSRNGTVHGAILLGHPEPDRFGERQQRLVEGLAAQAAVALDNAGLFESAQSEIEARTEAEAQQRLLVRELNHRVKNMLATVRAVLRLTARSSTDVNGFVSAFTARLTSLAATQTLLGESGMQTADLGRIIDNEIAPFRTDDGRVVLEGPPVELPSDLAVPLGMAFHELATNAVKHGSLSSDAGHLHVSWTMRRAEAEPGSEEAPARQLALVWQESGGPPVAVPEHHGFGSQLLDRVVRSQLRGQLAIAFDPDGLKVELVVRLP